MARKRTVGTARLLKASELAFLLHLAVQETELEYSDPAMQSLMRELAETMPIPEADVIVKVRDDKGLDGPPHGG